MTHLTYTGPNAGKTLCNTPREAGGDYAHAAYAPLDNPAFREQCCPLCLNVWAVFAYDSDDDMPEWVKIARKDAAPNG